MHQAAEVSCFLLSCCLLDSLLLSLLKHMPFKVLGREIMT